MKSKRGTMIAVAAICFIFLTVLGFTLLSQRVEFNEGSVTGNTAGNLNNGGLFCEADGVVYFSNPYDEGRLYSMTPEETRLKRLTPSKATSINADSHYLYYYMDSVAEDEKLSYMHFHGIYRSKLNGQDTQCLKRNYAITLQLCGNYLYYQSFDNNNKNGTELYKIKIDKSEDVRIADYNINPACCEEGLIYFNGTKVNHYLYALNTENDSISVVWDGNVWNPVHEEGYVYYMDVSHDYRLCRYSLSAKTEEVLTEDRIDFFNIYDGIIYYQKSSRSEPALKRMQTDGSNVEIVAEGVYKNINITSNYVYFSAFGSEVPVYKTPTAGGINVTTFDSAMEAALSEND
ncbi:uncharacterized protein DUF5050 [Kineothrix alysoides]|uniref:Uncharacterized protein DUF5050 n=1 Tax=Kineothrix alysoides TaxID=1469948 RepID=A0A4R1QSH0_9FIRM|nr:DUF5050 domain-containing protein [Kineothrix alysoides]TCL55983.1 uncharacterized protein DUF5050 [Kineothrix alysoides]